MSGKEMNTSGMRWTFMSTRPPKQALAKPISRPMVAPRKEATNPMVMSVWEPKIIRETTSRPKSSVPNQCTADGPVSMATKSGSSGS